MVLLLSGLFMTTGKKHFTFISFLFQILWMTMRLGCSFFLSSVLFECNKTGRNIENENYFCVSGVFVCCIGYIHIILMMKRCCEWSRETATVHSSSTDMPLLSFDLSVCVCSSISVSLKFPVSPATKRAHSHFISWIISPAILRGRLYFSHLRRPSLVPKFQAPHLLHRAI